MRKKNNNTLKLSIVAIFALIIILIFTFFIKVIIVSGDSMYPTFKNHQVIVAKRLYSNINVNDIVVFKTEEGLVVKRVFAIDGDIVELKNNGVYLNNIQIQPFTYDGENKSYSLCDDEFFVLGDNQAVSYDSRDYGLVKKENVIAVIKNK